MLPLIWAMVLITVAFDSQTCVARTFHHQINPKIPRFHLWVEAVATFYQSIVHLALEG